MAVLQFSNSDTSNNVTKVCKGVESDFILPLWSSAKYNRTK